MPAGVCCVGIFTYTVKQYEILELPKAEKGKKAYPKALTMRISFKALLQGPAR